LGRRGTGNTVLHADFGCSVRVAQVTAARPSSADDPGPAPDPAVLADAQRAAAAAALIIAGPASPAAQRLADLTATLLGTAFAQISLLADQQVLAAIHGVELSPEERASPLEDSLCSVTVSFGDLLAIDNAPTHPWVADLPPVLDGRVGSYLGAPIVDADGYAVGALCAYDPDPRRWGESDRSTLIALAAAVARELTQAAVETVDTAPELPLGLALSAAEIGSFDLNAVSQELVADARFRRFFGFGPQEGLDHLPAFVERIHEDDRDRILEALADAIARRSDYLVEHRVQLPNGDVRWLSVRGRVFADMLGRATRLSGIAYDTTVLRQSRDQLARLLETMTDAFFRLDRSWQFTYVNPEAERILGRREADLLGLWLWDAFPEAIGSESQQQYERAVRTGVPVSFEDYFAPLDMWYEVRATPDAEGLSVFFHDVSDRRRAEAQRELANGRLTLLAEATSLMAATLDADVGLERLAALLVPTFADWVVITQVDEDGVVRPAGFRHHEGREEEMAEFVAHNTAGLPTDSLTAGVLAGGPPVLLQTMDSQRVKIVVPEGRFPDLTAQLANSSFMLVPLIARGRVLGTIGLVATLPRWFTPEDLEVGTDLGRRAGLSLDNARLYAQSRTAQSLAESSSARLSLVAEVARSMNSTLDADEAMRRLVALVVSRLADWAVVMLRDDAGRMVDALARHRDAGRSDLAERFAAAHVGRPHEQSYVAQVARSGEPLLVRNAEPGQATAVNETAELPLMLTQLGLASLLVVPLISRDRTLGVLVLGRDEDSSRFNDDDLTMASDVGRRAGLSLENAQLYSRQRRAAEVLQRSLLTRLPEPDHLEVVARYLPAAEEAQVGGDWYDAFLQPDGATVLAIGDVVGHDMGAAAAMGQLRNLLRGTAYDREDTPAHTLSRVDAAIRGLQVDTLATAVIGRIEQTREDKALGVRRIRWSNAGHPPPMLLGADGRVTVLEAAADLLLGLDPRTERHDHEAVLEDGGTLLLYTDGLVERRDSPLDAGLARLRQALAALADQPLESLCDELLARLLPGEADDDVALVAVRAHPEDRPRPAGVAARNEPDLVRADLTGTDPDGEPAPASPHVAHLHLRGEATDVAKARRFMRTTASSWQIRPESVDSAVLVLSEVVTNAVRYAPGPVDVTMTHSAGVLRIDVADNAHDLGPRRPPATVDQLRPEAEGGRGLFLVESLSQRWGTTVISGDGKLVWFEIVV
jgi:PAS domain S-box-containing protein